MLKIHLIFKYTEMHLGLLSISLKFNISLEVGENLIGLQN